MTIDNNWEEFLHDHPIFSLKGHAINEDSLSLSLSSLRRSNEGPKVPELLPSGRRQVMCMKDANLLVACGSEIRIASLADSRVNGSSERTYKTLHTPNIQYDIRQLVLSPNGKLLAAAGEQQVAVLVLPKLGFSRLVTSKVDCRSVQIGQYHHATSSSPPIAKIDWHPWGESGSTLLVMTADGKLREYDVSADPEEPQQTVSLLPERKGGRFAAEDDAEREVVAFTLGKGRADWGPLTVYALTKSGDVYSVCPYLPQNASVPSGYVYALECYVAAKQQFLSQSAGTVDESFSSLYDYQHKYVNGLIKQLPPGTAFPSPSRSVSMHPPTTIKSHPLRQGPFLFQPSPPELEGSPGGDATDLAYVSFKNSENEADDADDALKAERVGVVLVAYSDGRVDVCLDLEKVEARWESRHAVKAFMPMFAVYEVVDLDVVQSLTALLTSDGPTAIADAIEHNYSTFHLDPIYDDTVYVYHAFGVHVLNFGVVLQYLTSILADSELDNGAFKDLDQPNTSVQHILNTTSVQSKQSDPVVAISIPDDVYLTYSAFILTSTMRISTFALNLRLETPESLKPVPAAPTSSKLRLLEDAPPAYVSLLQAKPFKVPSALTRSTGFSAVARLSLPSSQSVKAELRVTPDTLRYLASVVERITSEIREIHLGYLDLVQRTDLQRQEFERQQAKCREMLARLNEVRNGGRAAIQGKVEKVRAQQTELLSRMDGILRTLISNASPELNEHETKWFEELRRTKAQVLGSGRYDQSSLKTRLKLLQDEFDRLLPSLKEISKKEAERRQKGAENGESLGYSQVFALGKRSEAERAKIEDAMKHLTKLAARLDISSLTNPAM